MNTLTFEYDEARDTLTVEGVEYTGMFFRAAWQNKDLPAEGIQFRLMPNSNGNPRLIGELDYQIDLRQRVPILRGEGL